ncbi:unnamed protein product [Rangifer tarandus platyrhynchus]|uniref:Uncharacterized protein n=2 Tax=Rangifer tarandus platyrhynchus TaxID=3082113 RepID=A0ABN8ZS29_RANTA|nr:unnamed protein product [Rangifer tarandus platyrhynchus]
MAEQKGHGFGIEHLGSTLSHTGGLLCGLMQIILPLWVSLQIHSSSGARNSSLSRLFSSVAQLCLTLCNPMDCSTPGLPVHHQLLESTQTHVHRVGDSIQPSHPLSSPSSPDLNLFQHQGLFQ